MVIELTDKDVHWSFTGPPAYILGRNTRETIDPTPCYSHNAGIIQNTLDLVKNRTIDLPVTYYLGSHEGTARTNTWACESYGRYDEDKEEWIKDKIVFVHGKRVPPHPDVSRYLVAHEYGHHIQYMLENKLDVKEEELKERYREFRGLDSVPYYGPGTWHREVGEVFACDFRVVLAQIQTDFWPHLGVPRPESNDKVMNWWNNLLKGKVVMPGES